MAYTPTTWVDRAVATPNKYTKSGETGTEVTLVQAPGTITQAGTPVNASTMNKLETGLQAAAGIADSAFLKANTQLLSSGIDLNTVVQTGKYNILSPTNGPTALVGLWVFLDVTKYTTNDTYATQTIRDFATNRTFERRNSGGSWTAWTPLHKAYIAPSDTVILSALTERATTGTIKSFRLKHAGKYRLKGEMRVSSGSSTFDLRFGSNAAANLTADSVSGAGTSSTTYVSFTVEFTVPENFFVAVYVISTTRYMRNVTICGTEVYDNPNVNSVSQD